MSIAGKMSFKKHRFFFLFSFFFSFLLDTRVKAYPILRSIIYTKYTTVEINPQYLDQLLH
jgi:hypothetical protein